MTKIAEDVDVQEALPLHTFCDSDWAGDKESRKSTSGEIIYGSGDRISYATRNSSYKLR